MGVAKSVRKLMAEPVEMRIEEVIRVLEYFGYLHERTKGSHYQFKKDYTKIFTVPSHNMKVKKYYLKLIKSIIINL